MWDELSEVEVAAICKAANEASASREARVLLNDALRAMTCPVRVRANDTAACEAAWPSA